MNGLASEPATLYSKMYASPPASLLSLDDPSRGIFVSKIRRILDQPRKVKCLLLSGYEWRCWYSGTIRIEGNVLFLDTNTLFRYKTHIELHVGSFPGFHPHFYSSVIHWDESICLYH